jgi:ABC-type transport system involved in multi-copper enzyme maturation permease subunit
MDELRTWVRRRLCWSTTPRAWAERGAALALVLATVAGWWLSRGWGWEPRLVLAALWLAALAYLVRREIIVLLGPVFLYEILRFSRRRVHVKRVVYAAIMLATISYIYVATTTFRHSGPITLNEQASIAGAFFMAFFGIQMAIVGLLTPMMVAGAIADEKERRTLEFLLATDLRGREIVLSKLAARVALVLLLLLTGLPVLALLQFFGGIDPGELLASAVVSLVSLYSVSCLSVMMSCMARRGRDAILSTYVLIAGYLLVSALANLLTYTPLARQSVTLGNTTLDGGDLIAALHAGNPFVGFGSILQRQEAGAAFADVLREVLTNYALFHLAAGTLCLGLAVYRLRPIALVQAGENRGRRQMRVRRRPRIGSNPMRWKELHAERGWRFPLFVRLIVLAIVLFTFWPAVKVIVENWDDFVMARYEELDRNWVLLELNLWARTLSALIGTLLLISVALRGAGSITGERARQTLDELLTTPLTNAEIIHAKWLGSYLSPRHGWLWLGAVYLIGVTTYSVSFVGVLLAVIAWLLYATFFASLGVWCSVRSRNTFRATALTIVGSIFALGGHWAITGLGCYLPLSLWAGSVPRRWYIPISFQVGLTPPALFGALPMHSPDELSRLDHDDLVAIFLASLGPFLFAIVGVLLRVSAVHQFATKFSRTDRRQPDNSHAKFST